MTTLDSRIDGILDRVRKVADQTKDNLRLELHRIEKEKGRVTAHLDEAADQIRRTLEQLGDKLSAKRSPKEPRVRRAKRVRRNPEQLKREAEAIFQLIKAKGHDGAKGAEIRKYHPKVGPDIKGFLLKYGKLKVRTTGRKASMKYFAN
jgi:hypothetical protein